MSRRPSIGAGFILFTILEMRREIDVILKEEVVENVLEVKIVSDEAEVTPVGLGSEYNMRSGIWTLKLKIKSLELGKCKVTTESRAGYRRQGRELTL